MNKAKTITYSYHAFFNGNSYGVNTAGTNESDKIKPDHLAEAIQFRNQDREGCADNHK